MIFDGPSVGAERTTALRRRAKEWGEENLLTPPERQAIEARTQPEWRSNGLFASLAFFVLTVVGLAATVGLGHLMRIPLPGTVAAVFAILLAEAMIRGGKFFATGIEAALWIGALIAAITDLPSSGKPEALLVFAAAFALAGLRLRQPFFGVVAAVLVVGYVSVRSEQPWLTMIAAVVMTVAALAGVLREWERPSTAALLDLLVVVVPLAGYAAARLRREVVLLPLLLAATGIVVLVAGIARRLRVLLAGGALSVAVAAWEARSLLLPLPVEWQLMAGGALLVAVAALVARRLEGRTAGFTLMAGGGVTRYDEAMQLAGVFAAGHREPAAPAPQREGGGGSFGGAGASGDF